jgi:hypothetical protein
VNLDSYSVCKPVKGVCKSYAIWGNRRSMSFPLVYLRRPKHISDRDWRAVVDAVRLELPVSK